MGAGDWAGLDLECRLLTSAVGLPSLCQPSRRCGLLLVSRLSGDSPGAEPLCPICHRLPQLQHGARPTFGSSLITVNRCHWSSPRPGQETEAQNTDRANVSEAALASDLTCPNDSGPCGAGSVFRPTPGSRGAQPVWRRTTRTPTGERASVRPLGHTCPGAAVLGRFGGSVGEGTP